MASVGRQLKRRHFPPVTSTPVGSRMFPLRAFSRESIDASSSNSIPMHLKSSDPSVGVASRKEGPFKWPGRPKSRILSSARSRLGSFPSNVDCGGSLFDISNIGWDQEASSYLAQNSRGPHSSSSRPASADIYGSVPVISSVSSNPMPSRLTDKCSAAASASELTVAQATQVQTHTSANFLDSTQMKHKRKLSDSSVTSRGLKMLKKFALHKSCKEPDNNQTVVMESSTSPATFKRRPSFRDSIKGIFSRRYLVGLYGTQKFWLA
jgi:hypothetical protein